MLGWSTGILVVVIGVIYRQFSPSPGRARRLAGETARVTTPPAPATGWRAAFPPAQWLAAYRAQWLPRDAVAGVTLAAYAIPVSLAYATLAGLPPQYGIYCYLVGGLAYALFGSSRQLAVGPTSAISMLVGATVAGMAAGDPARWADIAALTALVVAVDVRAGVGAAAELARQLHQRDDPARLQGGRGADHRDDAVAEALRRQGRRRALLRARRRSSPASFPTPTSPCSLFGLAALALLAARARSSCRAGRSRSSSWCCRSSRCRSRRSAVSASTIVGELPTGLPDFRAAGAAAARRGRRHPARVRVPAARLRRRRFRRPHAGAEARLRDRSAPGAARARRGEPGRGVRPGLPGRRRPVAVVRERQGRREDAARARVRLAHDRACACCS